MMKKLDIEGEVGRCRVEGHRPRLKNTFENLETVRQTVLDVKRGEIFFSIYRDILREIT